ncbi:vacuolar sorting-associated 33B-like, partial [Paramuricea clavata]
SAQGGVTVWCEVNQNAEKQDLVIDQSLMKPFDRIAGATFLKEHGVDKIFKLERTKPNVCCDSQIYIVRPSMTQAKLISDHINADKNSGIKRTYKVIFVPKKFYVCEMILEQEGVYGDVIMEELTVDFIPMDSDVLSMEIPDFFRDYFLEGDQHWLGTISRAIMTLQTIFGTIPNVYGIGNFAKLVSNMLEAMGKDKSEFTPADGPEIDTLFLIDRDVDYVTPLCSQVTYEGLVDDIFEIKSGMVVFDQSVTGTDKTMTMLLNSNDEIYKEIRDRHFTNVFGFLSLKAKQLQVGYDIPNITGTTEYFYKIQSNGVTVVLNSFFNRIVFIWNNLSPIIHSSFDVNWSSACKINHFPLYRSLQLMCLMSVTRSGLDSKVYKSLRQQLLQTYGHQHLVDLFNLKKLGIFTENDKRNNFRNLNKRLNLVPKSGETIDLNIPTDMAYVFGGSYAPLSCKLVEQVYSRGGFLGLEEVTKLLGETFHTRRGTSNRASSTAQNKKKVILVFFLGGCTYSEITSLRFLAKQRGWKIIIATTSFTNSKRLLESVQDVL